MHIIHIIFIYSFSKSWSSDWNSKMKELVAALHLKHIVHVCVKTNVCLTWSLQSQFLGGFPEWMEFGLEWNGFWPWQFFYRYVTGLHQSIWLPLLLTRSSYSGQLGWWRRIDGNRCKPVLISLFASLIRCMWGGKVLARSQTSVTETARIKRKLEWVSIAFKPWIMRPGKILCFWIWSM